MRTETLEELRAKLAGARARLKEVQTLGDKALSEYDLNFGYDAEFYLNCGGQGRGLLYNHVRFYEDEIYKIISKQGEQICLF